MSGGCPEDHDVVARAVIGDAVTGSPRRIGRGGALEPVRAVPFPGVGEAREVGMSAKQDGDAALGVALLACPGPMVEFEAAKVA